MIAEHGNGGGIVFGLAVEPLPLIDPTAAAALVGLKRHTLACYRNLGDGPPYYKFGRTIRYAAADLLTWAGRPSPFLAPKPQSQVSSQNIVLIDTNDAARFLTVTIFFLKYHRRRGSGPRHRRYANHIYYALDDLHDWAETQRVEGSTRSS